MVYGSFASSIARSYLFWLHNSHCNILVFFSLTLIQIFFLNISLCYTRKFIFLRLYKEFLTRVSKLILKYKVLVVTAVETNSIGYIRFSIFFSSKFYIENKQQVILLEQTKWEKAPIVLLQYLLGSCFTTLIKFCSCKTTKNMLSVLLVHKQQRQRIIWETQWRRTNNEI